MNSAAHATRSKSFEPKNSFGPIGITVMVLFHLVLGYALVSGMARKAIQAVTKPVEAVLIEDIKLLPPPPPMPIVKQQPLPKPPVTKPKVPKPPKLRAPKPEVSPPPVSQSSLPEAPPLDVPPPPSPPSAISQRQADPIASAAPTASQETSRTEASDMAIACPKQVKPNIPSKALEEGISGTVKAQARIVDGKVVEVQILSGPRVYHAAVRAAMLRYECLNRGQLLATQDFNFSVKQ